MSDKRPYHRRRSSLHKLGDRSIPEDRMVFDERYGAIAYKMAREGKSNVAIAEALKINHITFTNHLEFFGPFLTQGRNHCDVDNVKRAETALMRRVCGEEYDEVKIEYGLPYGMTAKEKKKIRALPRKPDEILSDTVARRKKSGVADLPEYMIEISRVVTRKRVNPSDTSIIFYLVNRAEAGRWKHIYTFTQAGDDGTKDKSPSEVLRSIADNLTRLDANTKTIPVGPGTPLHPHGIRAKIPKNTDRKA